MTYIKTKTINILNTQQIFIIIFFIRVVENDVILRKEIYNANDAVYVFFSTQTTPFRYFFTPKIPIFQIGSLLHGLWYITSLRRSTDCLQVFNHHQESSPPPPPPPPPFGLFRTFRYQSSHSVISSAMAKSRSDSILSIGCSWKHLKNICQSVHLYLRNRNLILRKK